MDETSQMQIPARPPAVRATAHDQVASLAACGVTKSAIADQTGFTEEQVSVMLRDEKMKFEIKRLQAKLFAHDPKKRFKVLSERAFEVTEALMDETTKPGVRLRAAVEVFDRAFGKPEQKVALEGGSMIRQFFERLDALERTKSVGPVSEALASQRVIDVPEAINPNDVEISDPMSNPNVTGDTIDKWVDTNL